MDDLTLEKSGRALSVPGHGLCQGLVYLIKGLHKSLIIFVFLSDLRVACQTVGQQKSRVVGGGIAIYRDHIIGIFYHRA